jgi:hypothetical protein
VEPVDPADSRYAEDQLVHAVAQPRLTALGISTPTMPPPEGDDRMVDHRRGFWGRFIGGISEAPL